jgi:quercetin 2,3-dioxygenase
LGNDDFYTKLGTLMITVYPYHSLGAANFGWLNTHYHFSFADYHNPQRMGFGNLMVINDDTIQPDTGFPTHSHRDMEIITYVTQGAVTHKDSEGNKGITAAGNVQVMTAGTGISHSEYNLEAVETKLLQIWIKPRDNNLKPSWKTQKFSSNQQKDSLYLLVSGDGNAPLTINQDAKIFSGNLGKNQSVTHHLESNAYIVVTKGNLIINNIELHQGDGVEITKLDMIKLHASIESELLLIEI